MGTSHKIAEGYGNGKFGPEDNITREQMAATLWRYAKYRGYDITAAARHRQTGRPPDDPAAKKENPLIKLQKIDFFVDRPKTP